MKSTAKMRKPWFMLGILVALFIGMGILLINTKNNLRNREIEEVEKVEDTIPVDFTMDLLRKVNNAHNGNNYLVSPYSINVGLHILRDGASGNTYDEIDRVIQKEKIPKIETIEDRIMSSNALFIRNSYKDTVQKSYLSKVEEEYQADIIFDAFKTAEPINSWVSEKSKGMIDKITDNVSSDFVLGIANVLTIDVEWLDEFDCNMTTEQEFRLKDGSKMQTEMMHKNYRKNATYIDTDAVKGVILPYKSYSDNDEHLEFVALMPKEGIDKYISSVTKKDLEELEIDALNASDSLEIRLSLPRFRYEFNLDDFKDILEYMGIHDAFDSGKANFSNIIDGISVSEAKHKTYIELSETGTKASAVTYFGLFRNSAVQDRARIVELIFDEPFLYFIRDSKTKDIIFMGTVYEPNAWEGNICLTDSNSEEE